MNARQIKEAAAGIRFKWDPTISLGAVLQLGGVLVVGVGTFLYIAQSLRDGEAARTKYIPIIERLDGTVSLLQERFNNHAEAFREIRMTQSNQWRTISEMQADIAALKAKRGIGLHKSP